MNNNLSNYAKVYCSLHNTEILRLKALADKEKKTESQVLRQILDRYLNRMERKKLLYKPYRKCEKSSSGSGMKHIGRTITREQNKRLRLLTEKAGRGISELVREAIKKDLTAILFF